MGKNKDVNFRNHQKVKAFVLKNKKRSYKDLCLAYEDFYKRIPPYATLAKLYNKTFFESEECKIQIEELKKGNSKLIDRLSYDEGLKNPIWETYSLDYLSKASRISKKEILKFVQGGNSIESLIDSELLEEKEEVPRWWAYSELMNFARNSEDLIYEKVEASKLKRRINPETGTQEFWFSTEFVSESRK
jgi:hypothetical protein